MHRIVDKLARTVEHRFSPDDVVRTVAQPVTFTPFASARACSARCVFCSETLVHKEATVLGAALRPTARYPEQLREALRAVEGLPIGISLSGLESTDDPVWLTDVLDAVDDHSSRSVVDERVLYTNAAGLVDDDALVARLASFRLTRAEISRHAVQQSDNDAIMRFRDDVKVRANDVFARTVAAVVGALSAVRLVCVIQRGGVFDVDSASAYLDWARGFGVTDVVFRELSRTGDVYKKTSSLALVDDARVPITALRGLAHDAELVEVTQGYYYENERYLDRERDMLVTLEHSDYVSMKERHKSAVVHKLVFFANGHLCADWDPMREILVRT